MNRNPPWKVPLTRPGALGRRVSGPPTPARNGASSELGAPGDVATAVPAGTSWDSAGLTDTVVASKPTTVAVCTAPPAPKVMVWPASSRAVDFSGTGVAPA